MLVVADNTVRGTKEGQVVTYMFTGPDERGATGAASRLGRASVRTSGDSHAGLVFQLVPEGELEDSPYGFVSSRGALWSRSRNVLAQDDVSLSVAL